MTGLPPEVYAIWESYPWRFGEPYCLLKCMLTEMTASASILTIVAFTIERYIAICHPLQAHHYSRPSRYTIQKLSYRKQIARWLRTQYVEGINSNPMTLKG